MQETIQQIENEIEELFKDEFSGHDIFHLKRTYNIALTLQEKEGGDRLVVAVSALLHDLHRIIQKEKGKYCTPKESLPKIREILNKTNLTIEQKEKVLHCIEFHEEYGFTNEGKTVNDIETLILQDADNLDAMGAIGIGRTFSFGGAHNISMWIPKESSRIEKYNESNNDVSTIHHFYSKLLKLKENMNTNTAKKMAHERHKFMELFLNEFFEEWKGRK
jgi:uncharacterized protein